MKIQLLILREDATLTNGDLPVTWRTCDGAQGCREQGAVHLVLERQSESV
jgi:hypothetical protein